MVSSLELAVENIRRESEDCFMVDCFVDELDGFYSRVSLSYLKQGLSVETVGKLFFASCKNMQNDRLELERCLSVAKELVREKRLPFSPEKFEKAMDEWQQNGYETMHHSNSFRVAYKPAYRVIANEYVLFLSLFSKIDRLLEKGDIIVAIEGGSASGKTTLSETLKALYGCTVFHMDDFFLRPEQRTSERFAEVGGNIDRERFSEEILIPLRKKEPVHYRRFDCKTGKLGAFNSVVPKRLTVIEGAYSTHPEFSKYYDLSVFLDVSSELQKARIMKRNSPQLAKRFFDEWIPLEDTYFSKTCAKERCDIIVSIG